MYAYSGYGGYTLTLDVEYADTTSTSTTGGSSSSTSSASTTSTQNTQNPYTEESSQQTESALGMNVITTIGFIVFGALLGIAGLIIVKSRAEASNKKATYDWDPSRRTSSSTPGFAHSPRGSYTTPKRTFTDTPRQGDFYQPQEHQPDENDRSDADYYHEK